MATTSEADSSNSKDNDLKIEFDGTTVLCRVCGDKASGFHYGVHSCEGCKGFFRRSIQQKIQYRPCTKNQQCSILRINRNRCQYCRLKKCIAVGMSRDAVRFGRVPKREKAKILAAMQKVNQNSQEKHLNEQLEDENRLLNSILQAHEETCDYTKDKVAPLIERARTQPIYAHCPPQMACPLNPMPQHVSDNGGANRILEDFSERFSPAIRGVVEFAKRIPGFGMLSQDDQVTLLKAGVFEVLLVRLACMFDSQTNSMICLNGLVLRRESLHSASNARFLLDSMFDFADRLNSLKLTDNEIGLFCGVVVIAPDRPGLRNVDLVQKIHRKLDNLLHTTVNNNHPETPGLFSELKKKIPDLRTLNTLHSEKLLAYKMEPKNGQNLLIDNSETDITSNNNEDEEEDDNQQDTNEDGHCNYNTLLPNQLASTTTLLSNTSISSPQSNHSWHHTYGTMNGHNGRYGIRQTNSPNACNNSDWSDSKDCHDNLYGSPRSVDSSVLSTDESFHPKSPQRPTSVSSAKSMNGYETGCYSPSEQMAQFHIGGCRPSKPNATAVRLLNSNGEIVNGNESILTSGETETFYGNESSVKPISHSTTNNTVNYSKIRRVDSPTDSGIESGKEQCNGSTPTTSVCSSPRSAMDDKVKDVSDSESNEKPESIDDMPMLKRALQAPPLINTNMLMDEAYRHHKKFRASKRESEPQSPSTTTYNNNVSSGTTPNIVQSYNDSLASSHTTLVKTLEQAPRYMNEQQLKRTDLIHNIIMRTEAVPASSSNNNNNNNTSNSSSNGGNLLFHSSNGLPSGPTAIGSKGVVVCPPGYYIPSGLCPYSNTSSNQSQVRNPSMTTTTQNGTVHTSSQMIPRIMYASSEAQVIQQHQRSPCHPTTTTMSSTTLVKGSNSPPPPPPPKSLTIRSSNGTTSATVAILMSNRNDSIDSQPLNLSKKPSPPNSPPTVVKIES